ncbi:peptide/nickel transport system substrate-binding protein [Pseudochelatococcus lubricantis]|uniref:Peptide/nickel transport system substrate-binding protein n=1 Tax=Pseudochelatococcus lubricantis TaxID=1538102 RepID=A0ABX0V4E0_9HYPH|nr:ABC transporter substrate-binding protein [Pseudochelatococcus lubricantis]NIJ58944.1 peptide/nickel transport system substrate-binding protein [Pseudochelatococcus lubricantis]
MKFKVFAATALMAALSAPALAQELKVGSQNMPPFLDPGRDHSNVGQQFYVNTFDVLIDRDAAKADADFRPGLATEWKRIDPTTMELKLRQGVTFHNGDPLTADDVVFSLNRLFQPTFAPYAVRSRDRFGNFKGAEKVDDFTVRIQTHRPEPLWETLLNTQQLMIIPAKYTKALTGDPNVAEDSDFEAFSLAPVGTGPYRISEYVPGERLTWERFDSYWDKKAPLEKVSMIRIPEMASRITALKSGAVDFITNIPPDQIATIESDQNLKVEGAVTPLFHLIIYNTQHELMKNPKFRQALNLAVDRETLNEALWLGKGVVPTSHTFPQFGELYMPEPVIFKYDVDEAKKLLAESGYNGEEIRLDTSATYYTNGFLAMQAVSEMWNGIGVKTRINVDDKWTGGDPTMNVRNWSNPMYFADPFGGFGVMWAPGGPAESEGRIKTDAAFAETFDKFRFSEKVEDRKAAYAALMERTRQDPPFLVLYQPYESWAMRKNVNWRPLPGHIAYVLDFRNGAIGID